MIPRRCATGCKPGGAEALAGARPEASRLHVVRASPSVQRAVDARAGPADARAEDGLRPLPTESQRQRKQTTQGTADRASLDAITRGEGEPGNALPTATRRTSRPGRPRRTWPAAPLRHLRLVGLPGERAMSAFPLPGRGEGAEGVG